jgi:hypothetical protein
MRVCGGFWKSRALIKDLWGVVSNNYAALINLSIKAWVLFSPSCCALGFLDWSLVPSPDPNFSPD